MTVVRHPHHKLDKLFRLRLALILTALGMILEFMGGVISNSLALISDAGHMLTHLFALGMSYLALLLSGRPATKKRTYGFYRAEILAAFINAIALILIAAYLVYKAILRLIAPEEVKIYEMLFVALIGLMINGTSAFLLAKVSRGDLNMRSAFIHELGDMASSVAVVTAAAIIYFNRNYIIDPLLSLLICVLIVVWATRLIMESGHILLESTPKHLDIEKLVEIVKDEIPQIFEIHHVHAWTIASSIYALTAHVVIEDCRVSKANEILDKMNNLVKERFHIGHTNIQFECLIKQGGKPDG